MERLDVVAPGEEHAVVAPAARNFDRNLAIRRSIEGPIIGGDDALDHLERVQIVLLSGPLVS